MIAAGSATTFRAPTVLIVDDAETNLNLLQRVLRPEGYVVLTADNGRAALESVVRDSPDVVLLDVTMPGLDGLEVCRRIKQDPRTRLLPVVLVTATEDRVAGIEAGADDFLAKPFDRAELIARVRSLLRLKRHTDELDSAEAVILSLALTIEARDPYTDGHCQRLAQYAEAVGRRLALAEEDLAALRRGGYLHDIGKVGVPDAILFKPAPLTAEEFELMKQHTIVGDRLCGQLRLLNPVRPIVRWHHERLDGSGYPDGLRGDAIPLFAQILALVDVYDALTTARPYRPALSRQRALEELERQIRHGLHRDDLARAFFAVVENDGPLPSLGRGWR